MFTITYLWAALKALTAALIRRPKARSRSSPATLYQFLTWVLDTNSRTARLIVLLAAITLLARQSDLLEHFATNAININIS